MTTPDDPATPLDFAVVKDGVVGPVVRWPVGPEAFGPDADGEVLPFAPSDRVCEGMLWDGEALSAPVVEPAPPARLRLPKSLVQDRMDALGKLNAAFTALMGQPRLFARWTASDHPAVYADDADMLMLFGALGMTADEVAAVTAPPEPS